LIAKRVDPSLLRYRFQTLEIGGHDIHYRSLRDRQQFEDNEERAEKLGISPASWSMFGVVWQAGEVLAQLMAVYDIDSRRILEVGCGVGLASLVLNKRHANISATDYHPSARRYLNFNVRINGDRKIPFLRAGWGDPRNEDFGLFDLIIASDVMFEPDHAAKLAHFLELYAKPRSEIILVEAGRGYMPEFSRYLEQTGFERDQLPSIAPFTDAAAYKGKILRFRRGY